jgi:WD40 repeat protein
VSWSPDGAIVASASQDGSVRLWEAATGSCLVSLLALPNGWAAMSPDGRLRVGGDTAGAVWQVVGLCRFEPGELDAYLAPSHRVSEGTPLLDRKR